MSMKGNVFAPNEDKKTHVNNENINVEKNRTTRAQAQKIQNGNHKLGLSRSQERALSNPKPVKPQKVRMAVDYGFYYGGVFKYFNSKDDEYFANLYRDHFRHTYVSLQFCRNLKPPGKKDLLYRKTTLPRNDKDIGKKTLVLDLDET